MPEAVPIAIDLGANEHVQQSAQLLSEGVPFHIVDAKADAQGVLHPTFLIVRPDYLLDVSAVASAYHACGASAYRYLLKKFEQAEGNKYFLFGHMANASLYACIHAPKPSFAQVKEACQREHAIEFATASGITPAFFEECEHQFEGIRQMVNDLGLRGRSLLETDFLCPTLGLQGRFDLLTTDAHTLIELKSGKKDEYRLQAKEEHAIQVLLYRELLHYSQGIGREAVRPLLLYAKYPELIDVSDTHTEQRIGEALTLRNRIVHLEHLLCQGKARDILRQLRPEHLLTRRDVSQRLWTDYERPRIERLLSPLQQMEPEVAAHFHELLTFISREQWLSLDGSLPHQPTADARSQSSLWRLPAEEKTETGDLLTPLRLKRMMTDANGLAEALIFSLPPAATEQQANFRAGDTIIIYTRAHEEDDVTNSRLMRMSIERITPHDITLRLRQPMALPPLEGIDFAMEHDTIHSGFTPLYRGLGALAEGGLRLRGRVRLVIGPPGTGKTSVAMREMVEQHIASGGGSLLLSAYTNRAVDEICQMLHTLSPVPNYLRIGREMTCDARYHGHLLSQLPDAEERLAACKQERTPLVVVGTLSTLIATPALLALTSFDLAIFDEASQILEPYLLPLLCHRQADGSPTLRQIVLIGDDKQLPAVVTQQTASPARESLFHHLLSSHHSAFPATRLTRQGRMHPAIARFVNEHFYGGQLASLGLQHQRGSLYPPAHSCEAEELLARERLLFVDVPTEPCPAKSNPAEARVIAGLVRHIRQLCDERSVRYSLGIIVPYRRQIACVRRHLLAEGEAIDERNLLIDTVERFQGSQRDIIIYGLTISRAEEWDFLATEFGTPEGQVDRKLNVAVSRACRQFILVGSRQMIAMNAQYDSLRQICAQGMKGENEE